MTDSIVTQYLCSTCNRTQPIEKFYLDKRRKSGTPRQPCRECANTQYRRDNPQPQVIDLPGEEWHPIPQYPTYAASTHGRVKRLTEGQGTWANRLITAAPDMDGYMTVGLYVNNLRITKKVHQLVCYTFHGDPPNPKDEVNHKNANKADNSPDNLEWTTRQENVDHKIAHGLQPRGERSGRSKLKAQDIPIIRQMIEDGIPMPAIGKHFGVSDVSIWQVKHRKSWAHIS